jgi:endogenous inhibitor of DNA gyrase (YacG/DUF329 family)
MKDDKIVRCPNCGGDSVYSPLNSSRPFCSERCKNMDFGAWASENFRVAVSTAPEDHYCPVNSAPIVRRANANAGLHRFAGVHDLNFKKTE